MEDYKSGLLNEQIESLLNGIFSTNGVLLDDGNYNVVKATANNTAMIPSTVEDFRSLSYLKKQDLTDMAKYTAAEINMGAQRKMIVKRGAPHADLEGMLHQLYRDYVMNYVYYCSKVNDETYEWKTLSKGHKDNPELIVATTEKAVVTATLDDEEITLVERTYGTFNCDLTGFGTWRIKITYGTDTRIHDLIVSENVRYFISEVAIWSRIIELIENDVLISLDGMVQNIYDEGNVSLQIPIMSEAEDTINALEPSNMIGTITDSVIAICAEVMPVNMEDNVNVGLSGMIDTITEEVSVSVSDT